jgi:hypothetical protein
MIGIDLKTELIDEETITTSESVNLPSFTTTSTHKMVSYGGGTGLRLSLAFLATERLSFGTEAFMDASLSQQVIKSRIEITGGSTTKESATTTRLRARFGSPAALYIIMKF